MNWIEFKNCLLYLFGDKIIISIIEMAILAFLIIAIIKNKTLKIEHKRSVVLSVERGDLSWRFLGTAFGIVSALSIQIVGLSESFKGYKVIITLFNQISFLCLCYFNNWFRNKLISLRSKLRIEK